jgi:mannose PTS system EIIA component
MNSILIVAHAPLAHALREIALHVFPEVESHIAAFDVQTNDSPEASLQAAEVMFKKLAETRPLVVKKDTAESVLNDTEGGVIVLCDILGATPCNIASQLVEKHASKLVTGVNVPMLLRVMTYRHETLEQLAALAVAGGTQGVMAVAMTAPQHQSLQRHDQNQHDYQQ